MTKKKKLTFFVGGPGLPVGDVELDRPSEQDGLLSHVPDLVPVPGNVKGLDVHAVEGHYTRGRIVKAEQELGHGRLASAGRTHKGERLAYFDLERERSVHLVVRPGRLG